MPSTLSSNPSGSSTLLSSPSKIFPLSASLSTHKNFCRLCSSPSASSLTCLSDTETVVPNDTHSIPHWQSRQHLEQQLTLKGHELSKLVLLSRTSTVTTQQRGGADEQKRTRTAAVEPGT
nr:hypothetical protein VIGAN_08326900 [Ipomoea trifida]